MNETKKTDLKSYEAPETKRTQVELEESVCVTASGQDATVNTESAHIEVEEYTTIDNDVTFN